METKAIFKDLYRRARIDAKARPGTSAFWLEDAAVSDFFEERGYGAGIDRVLEVGKAVLWACHWRFCPQRTDKREWQSERHLCFVLAPADSGNQAFIEGAICFVEELQAQNSPTSILDYTATVVAAA